MYLSVGSVAEVAVFPWLFKDPIEPQHRSRHPALGLHGGRYRGNNEGVASVQAILSSDPNITFLAPEGNQSAKTKYISTYISRHADPIIGLVGQIWAWMMAVNRVALVEVLSIGTRRLTKRRIYSSERFPMEVARQES